MTSIRSLTSDDLGWVVDLCRRRRESLVVHATRFWKPSPGATASHTAYLGSLLDDDGTLSIRTGHGFLFGLPTSAGLVVDDMVVDGDAHWPTEGTALLAEARGRGLTRFVCPVFEATRSAAARRLGLVVGETWWHRDLAVADDVDGTRTLPSSSRWDGRLVGAPPVYDPGGPALLVTRVDDAEALVDVERVGARCAAVVSVVSERVGDGGLGDLLTAAGYVRTTDFYTEPGPTT